MNPVDIVGIDLGTTKSVIAVWDQTTGMASVLSNHEGELTTPSVVALDPSTGQLIAGATAVTYMVSQPGEVFYSVKRFIGRTAADHWVHHDRARVTYAIEEDAQHLVRIAAGDRVLSPSQVSAIVLRKLKEDAEATLKRRITQAVISVPAYFNESQRRATQEAGQLAGLSVPRIISEPTAAALAFGLGTQSETVAVYDLGGGTFDVSVLRIEHGLFRVKAIGGDTHLGGDDFDQAIVSWLHDEFKIQYPSEPLTVEDDPVARAKFREAAKRAKELLTDATEHYIQVSDLPTKDGHRRDLETTLSRETLNELIQPFIDRSLHLVDETLVRAGVDLSEISQILLVGSQTRTPAVRAAIRDRYARPINHSVQPEEVVARGAAMLGARLSGHLKEQLALWDVIPLSLGIELADGRMDVIVSANEQIPVEKWRRGAQGFTTQRDGQGSIRFKVFQGERPLAIDNAYIGEVVFTLTTSRRAGEHRINCLFKVDHNGILTVRAESADTDSVPSERVFAYGALSTADVEALRNEAEIHRDEDERTRQILELSARVAEMRIVPTGSVMDNDTRQRLDEVDAALSNRDIERAVALLDEAGRVL